MGPRQQLTPEREHLKELCPDYQQLVYVLTTSADQAVLIAYRVDLGTTEDLTTHIAAWDPQAVFATAVATWP